ncbi:MAG: GGDEF domain-containing protein [Nocardioidaceae bacterium]
MRFRWSVGLVVLGCAAFTGVLTFGGLSTSAAKTLSNLGQLVAASAAALCCLCAARRTEGRQRRAWHWFAGASASWAAGQVVWTIYETYLGREAPFPSLADLGYVLFPALAACGLWIWLGSQGTQLVARGRDLLDGAIIAGSLLVVSWVTMLAAIVDQASTGDRVKTVLQLAYPIGDLVLATLALLALVRGTSAERVVLGLLSAGLGSLAVADSLYVYLDSLDAYNSGDPISAGWVWGFALVGFAACAVPRGQVDDRRHRADEQAARPSRLRLALPYLPLLAAGAVLFADMVERDRVLEVDLLLGFTLVTMVLARQFLAMLDHHRLLGALADAQLQLRHQALHDSLTGLPNRVLFADRLERALMRPGADVHLLFCDLDDFKLVNDRLGHPAGDALLREVADRLLTCVRATDTVARLGGDEFGILLEDSADAPQVADRVVAAMQEDVVIGGHQVRTTISVGVAHHRATVPTRVNGAERRDPGNHDPRPAPPATDSTSAATHGEAAAELLLQHADTAMYAAKGAGKGQVVIASPDEVPVSH